MPTGCSPARFDIDFLDTHERLRADTLRLGQVLRLNEAEAKRAILAGTYKTPREAAEAWNSATALLAQTIADLRGVETTMIAQFDDVLNALRTAEHAT